MPQGRQKHTAVSPKQTCCFQVAPPPAKGYLKTITLYFKHHLPKIRP
ncbi:hypothetical protein EIKCOROL_00041 [Eikenella corrodens ATCC 23834]|uniref:Uncharacterized protein n=1 Tax=Eikenella corrodens ATCC 23834 TaxID=546274 RepID=C0DRS5_EIKCO|nr:hypothetical protein EIKCOROL_00041 [Eikenella corrodens ATCC 23834]